VSAASPTDVLRPGLLAGRSLLLAGAAELTDSGRESEALFAALGASVARVVPGEAGEIGEQERLTGEAVAAAVERLGGSAGALVVDCGSLLAEDSEPALLACMQAVWDLTRASAERCFIADGQGGRVILQAPEDARGAHARAAVAALENLARTLSIEWARYQTTAVAIAPGTDTSAGEVASVCAFLASPAGDYFSGCLLDLRGPRPSTAHA
jgi:NAD(P)-dependent dehydrogenase (short-subunit alcohol dehydrogenase family)